MPDRSQILVEMHETMESLLVTIEENFTNDPAFRQIRKVATEMKNELEEVLELYENQ